MSDQTVRDVGEFGLIAALRDALPKTVREDASLRLPIGDDTALWEPKGGESLLVTTDTMVEGVHFNRAWTDWRTLGRKALAVNLSDIAAMGGNPRLAVVTLGLTGEERVEDLLELYRGIGERAATEKVLVGGGDIVRSPGGVSISVTLLGETRGGKALSRAGAQPEDMILVSGMLGASAAGLALLQLPEDDPRRMAMTAERLIQAHLDPQPRVNLGRVLLAMGATSAMDLSDGLFGDLPKILTASGVRGQLRPSRIPVPAAARSLFPKEAFDMATRGGEDYELLVTVPPDRVEAVELAAKQAGHTLSVIGKIFPPDADKPLLTLLSESWEERPVDLGAWDHFGR